MPSWDESADWYATMVTDRSLGFNELAADVALGLLGEVRRRHVLDLGCGEGHVARRLARAGATVTAVDPTAGLLAVARQREAAEPLGIDYRPAAAEDLGTVPAGSLDAVCAVLVLHHTDPLAAALAEAHRVLRPGGALAMVIPHPAFDHPRAFWSEAHRVLGTYATEGFWSTSQGGPASAVHEIGWQHHTLAIWLTSLAEAGFRLERALEPLGRDSNRADAGGRWRDLPRFLALRLSRP